MALEKEWPRLKDITGVNGFEIGSKLIDGKPTQCIVLHVEEKIQSKEGIDKLLADNQFIPPFLSLSWMLVGVLRVLAKFNFP